MSPKQLVSLLIILLGAVWSASPARAQIGGSDLPDLSGLAGAIEQSVKNTPPPPAPKSGKLFDSGMVVPSVHPGEAARAYGRKWREAIEKKSGPNPTVQQFETAMPQILTGTEAVLVKQGFAKRDMGVALGVFFVGNWELATKHELSDTAQAAAVRAFAANPAMQKWKAHYLTLSPSVKEKSYEILLVSTMFPSILAQQYDKTGKTEAADAMRKAAAVSFQTLGGKPPDQVTIGPDGRISTTDTAVPPAETAPPVTDTSPLDAPPAGKPSGPQGKASPHGVKPSQIAGIYCQPAYGGGAGGGVSVSYEPVLALKDGTYCGGYEVPPSELDIAASRRAHPADWGRWRRAGGEIQTLTGKGQWQKSGWIGPLPPSGPGQQLSGRYTKISGGGNSALGGDITITIQDSFVFSPNGTFQSGHTNSITSSQVAGGASQAGSGTYAISRNAITLRFASGSVKRWSYAKTADGLVFLHGSAYVDDK